MKKKTKKQIKQNIIITNKIRKTKIKNKLLRKTQKIGNIDRVDNYS